MTAHTDGAVARAAEAASSPMLAKVRQALAHLDNAHEIEGRLSPDEEAKCAAAAAAVKRAYAMLDDVMMQIPNPPESIGDIAALAVIGYWHDADRHGQLSDRKYLGSRTCARLIEAVLAWVGLDPADPKAVLGTTRARRPKRGASRPDGLRIDRGSA